MILSKVLSLNYHFICIASMMEGSSRHVKVAMEASMLLAWTLASADLDMTLDSTS